MKVIFLDIDGVLNCHRSAIAFGGCPFEVTGKDRAMFDEVALGLIRGIAKVADASIVLSSSWRTGSNFPQIGPCLELPIIDRTPYLMGPRGTEVAAWLTAHPEADQYAIVDDDADMLPEQLPFFVRTHIENGFLWNHALQLAQLMGISIFDVNHPRLKQPAPTLAWE